MVEVDTVEARVRQVIDGLLLGEGRDYIGEPVSQLEHALQCAALADAVQAPTHEVLAALLHDMGHLIAPEGAAQMDGLGVVDHEGVGAAWLASLGFGPDVCLLVASHVQAKRYLAQRKSGYHDRLSSASRATLRMQGGPMSVEEAAAFETDPWFAAKVRLRMWDEAAKEPHLAVPGPKAYAQLMREHLEQAR